jgi:F0F1-type ATP synthase delta subunit
MKKEQIKKLAYSVVASREISENVSKWMLNNLSKADMKLFLRYFNNALREATVVAQYSGVLSEISKEKFQKMFPDKNIVFVRKDKEIGAGIKINFGDYILDYTISTMVEKIMKDIRENL